MPSRGNKKDLNKLQHNTQEIKYNETKTRGQFYL